MKGIKAFRSRIEREMRVIRSMIALRVKTEWERRAIFFIFTEHLIGMFVVGDRANVRAPHFYSLSP